ncbi:MAG: hypothetical protein V3S37_02155 [Dehalococcoidia bacterium]
MSSTQTAHLEEWRVVDAGYIHLRGIVTGHPKLPDGTSVRTSTLHEVNYQFNVAFTLNTLYTLGEPAKGKR